MSTPLLGSQPAVVGRFYMVPCMKVNPIARTHWMDTNGWIPVIGPKHRDVEHLNFQWEHYHIDWRFIGHKRYQKAAEGRAGTPLARVLSNTGGSGWEHKLIGEPELRRIKCKREMPEFPCVPAIDVSERRANFARMERAQAFTCNKLKPGNICPHRGIDLTPFIQADGTAICPGHGLKWNTVTGEQLPHHAEAL